MEKSKERWKLENEALCVEIISKGAELTRIYDKEKDTEILWEGDPAFWGRHAPVLFPNVGKTYKNTVKINGVQYPTSQHGFARDQVFQCVSADSTKASFVLEDTPDLRERYPFAFRFTITYELMGKKLSVQWKVENPSEEPMYFTIGGHPAFRFAEKEEGKTDYLLQFPGKERLEYVLFDFEHAAANPDKVYNLELNDGFCPMDEEMFRQDALIFDGGQVEEIWICHKDGTPYVGMEAKRFPSFGVWSVEGAPFVCLEPWDGRCDNIGFDRELSEKPDVVKVDGNGTYLKEYTILVGKPE